MTRCKFCGEYHNGNTCPACGASTAQKFNPLINGLVDGTGLSNQINHHQSLQPIKII